MRKLFTAISGLVLALWLSAPAAQAADTGWHVGSVEPGAAWAWVAATTDANKLIMAVWIDTPQDLGDTGHHTYNGMMFIEEMDCAASKIRNVREMYYDAQGATINALRENGDWRPLEADGGFDTVALAKCAGQPITVDTGQTNTSNDPETVIKWLKGLAQAAAAKP